MLAGCTTSVPGDSTPQRVTDTNLITSTSSTPDPTTNSPATYFPQSPIEIGGPLVNFDLTSSLTDLDGYTFDAQVKNRFISAELDPTQDRPGFTSILLDYDTTTTVTNTLKERVLSLSSEISSPAMATLMAVWPADRVICQAHIEGLYGQVVPSSVKKSKLCAIQLGLFELNQKIAGGASYVFDPEKTPNLELPGVRSIPEDSVDQVLSDLNTPAGIVVDYHQYGRSPRFAEEYACVDKNVPGINPVRTIVWLSYPDQQCQPATRVLVQQPKS